MASNTYVGKVSFGEIITWALLLIVMFFTIIPIVFMFVASFMDAKQILSMPFSWIPSRRYFTSDSRTFFTNFHKAIYGNNNNPVFLRDIWNSLVVALADAASTVMLASLCGYGLAKFKFKGRTFVFMAIMATMMIPLRRS